MKTAITVAAALPPLLAVSCWHACECEAICPAVGAIACIALALGTALAIYVAGSVARELHLLTH